MFCFFYLLQVSVIFSGETAPCSVFERHITNLPKPLSIIRPQPQRKRPYERLRCTEDDKKTIYTIISRVGRESKFYLLKDKFHFDMLGAKIERVHPLKFLEVIFSDSILASCMQAIFNDFWKRINFMPEMRARLQAKYDRGELLLHVDKFSKALELPPEEVRILLEEKQWDAFLWYLINEKNQEVPS